MGASRSADHAAQTGYPNLHQGAFETFTERVMGDIRTDPESELDECRIKTVPISCTWRYYYPP
jgi:hypothetical protein